jgi:hypothetical protein
MLTPAIEWVTDVEPRRPASLCAAQVANLPVRHLATLMAFPATLRASLAAGARKATLPLRSDAAVLDRICYRSRNQLHRAMHYRALTAVRRQAKRAMALADFVAGEIESMLLSAFPPQEFAAATGRDAGRGFVVWFGRVEM